MLSGGSVLQVSNTALIGAIHEYSPQGNFGTQAGGWKTIFAL